MIFEIEGIEYHDLKECLDDLVNVPALKSEAWFNISRGCVWFVYQDKKQKVNVKGCVE